VSHRLNCCDLKDNVGYLFVSLIVCINTIGIEIQHMCYYMDM